MLVLMNRLKKHQLTARLEPAALPASFIVKFLGALADLAKRIATAVAAAGA